MSQDPAAGLALPCGWTAERTADAVAVAAPNDRLVAAAAARLLTPQDHPEDFAAWCDAHAQPRAPGA